MRLRRLSPAFLILRSKIPFFPCFFGKLVSAAKKSMINVVLVNDTIPHDIKYKYKSSVIFLRPARPGTGIIAGGSIRQVLDLVGVKNVLSKMLGSSNKVNNVMATYEALSKMKLKESRNA